MTTLTQTQPKLHTEWTPAMEVGDFVNVPFFPACRVTERLDDGDWVEFHLTAPHASDQVVRLPKN